MINHHQNININICYNMQSQKNNKNITGKKIQKIIKTSSITNCFNPIDNKYPKKNNQNNLKKANQPKNIPEHKKNSKKKNITLARNTQTPDLFIERRLKTEGGVVEPENSSFKKEHKKPEFKSTHPAFFKNNLSVKKQKITKHSKFAKESHIKSCEMYGGWKRLNNDENALPHSMHSISKKKRANSAILRNDKVVSRLLNISLLDSQLGGSQPITSQRTGNILNHSKSFKECMSSIDMRIIRNIQDDIPIFQKKESKGNEMIRLIMKSKAISLQQLTKKAVVLQRAWRMKKKTSIIDIYRKLFIKATNSLQRQVNPIDNVSLISQQSYHDSLSHFQIFKNQNLAIQFKKSSQNSCKSFDRSQGDDQYPLRWIEEHELDANAQPQDQLNFKKYKQLVKEEIISLNKKIPIPSKKLGLDSKLLIDELIKQNFNKKWIEDQSQSNSARRMRANDDNNGRPPYIQEQDIEHDSDFNRHSIQTFPKRSKHEEDDSFDDSQVYNYKKYAMNGLEMGQQSHLRASQQDKASDNNSTKVKVRKEEAPQQLKENQEMDKKWINNEILNDNNVVRSYLDCGLDNFSLQIKRLADEKYSDQNNSLIQIEKEQCYSSDEAIGVRFERANLGILRKTNKPQEEDFEPIIEVSTNKIMEDKMEQIVSNLIEFLINQFSSDISLILRKSVNPAPVQRHPIGIETNYNSIKLYISQFIEYASQNGTILNKVTENINKDIAPSSLEILTYLRPQQEEDDQMNAMDNEDMNEDDEDGLFVVPAEMFQEYQNHLETENRKGQQKEAGPRVKAYLSFWHRAIFQSYNQCLDYQRPYGIEGRPYQWVRQMKINRPVQRKNIVQSLHKAQMRMLELSTVVCGIIFEKPDSPFEGMDFSDDQMHMMNEQRLSRVLATELLENEKSWINYNDELAELLVQLSRMIEQKLFFEQGSEIKKLYRRRKLIASQSLVEKGMQFNIDELE